MGKGELAAVAEGEYIDPAKEPWRNMHSNTVSNFADAFFEACTANSNPSESLKMVWWDCMQLPMRQYRR